VAASKKESGLVRPLRISSIDETPLAEVHYLNAAPGGGTVVERLPISLAHTARLGEDLDAIVVCSDLQGIVRGRDDVAELLGVHVVDVLEELAFDGKLPPIARMGAILAGDLYSVPEANKRGGYGDVTEVWAAFASRFAWVAGVAGNHDDVSAVPEIGDNVFLLDGEVAVVDGIRIGGVAGIIGTKPKPGRRTEEVQLGHLERVIASEPDIVVLHEGPHGEEHQLGNAAIRAVVEDEEVALTVCGHCHWPSPLAAHANGQILNVDARVIVLVGS
jgi:Icc-related predicted phosphoesterase